MTLRLDLSAFGLSVADLRQALSREVELCRGDLLLACGSLVEGVGNRRSDLDLLLLTERAGPDLDRTAARPILVGTLPCDLLVVQPDAVRALGARLERVSRADLQLRAAAKEFTPVEQRLLHRIRHSLPLLPAEGVSAAHEALRQKVPGEALARLGLKQAWYEARALKVDLAGMRDAGDWPSLIFAAQDLLGWTVAGLLAAHGSTNPTAKWRLKLLERLSAEEFAGIPGVPPGAGAAEWALELNASPRCAEAASAPAYASSIADFARSTFLWAAERLLAAPGPIRNLRAPEATDGGWDERLPGLDLDVHLQPAAGGYELFRLNGTGQRIPLDPALASLATLFDGKTTLREASHACRMSGLPAGAAEALAKAFVAAGLTVPLRPQELALEELLRGV